MDKQEFLKQMIEYGQKLIAEENKDSEATSYLQDIYDSLDVAVNSVGKLNSHFQKNKDKRTVKTNKAMNLIMQVQELMNPIAEDYDICLM